MEHSDSQNKNTHQDYSQLGVEKFQLENEKLKLEISDLKKNPFKKSSFWTSFFPVIIAIIVAAYGFYTGFFDRQRQLNEIESKTLAYQADTLKTFFEKNKKINDNLLNQIETLHDSITYLKDIENSIKKKYTFHEEREMSEAELLKETEIFLLDFKNTISKYQKTYDSLNNTQRRNEISQRDYDYLNNSNNGNFMDAFNYRYAPSAKLYRQKILEFLPKYDSAKDKKLKFWESSPESPFWNEEYDHAVNSLDVEAVYKNLDYLFEELKNRKD